MPSGKLPTRHALVRVHIYRWHRLFRVLLAISLIPEA
jgi:hypothetical protein